MRLRNSRVVLKTALLILAVVVALLAQTPTGGLTASSGATWDITLGTFKAVSVRPGSDSTTGFQVQNAAGTGIMDFDTTNSRVGINKTPGAFDLDVAGAVNFSSTLAVTTSVSTPIYTATGSLVIKPGANATTAVQIQNAAGSANIVTVDTTNKVTTLSGPNATTLFRITDSTSGAVLLDATGSDLNSGSYMRTGIYRAFTTTNYTTEPIRINGPSSRIDMNANTYLAFYATTGSITGAPDTVLSRDAAGVIDFGTTGQGSKAGSWNATNGTLSNQLVLSGNVTLPTLFAKITAAATAPSAGNCTLRWEVGTNAGTGKLVAYCGTSSTGVTVIDNVGAGF